MPIANIQRIVLATNGTYTAINQLLYIHAVVSHKGDRSIVMYLMITLAVIPVVIYYPNCANNIHVCVYLKIFISQMSLQN